MSTEFLSAKSDVTWLIEPVAVGPDPEGPAISQADFRVVGTNVLIYIDGAAFHTGSRLQRDRAFRKALREGSAGWKIVELTAHALRAPEQVRGRIRGDHAKIGNHQTSE